MSERIRAASKESLHTKEILVPKFGLITISGPSGPGKSITTDVLGEIYSIPKDRIIKTGNLMRLITDSGQVSQGFIKRAEYVDKELDRMQREYIRNSSPQSPVILEGRLAGVIANEERRKNPELNVVSILMVAPSEIRMKRILKRHLEDNPETQRLKIELDNALESGASADLVSSILHDIESKGINLKTVKAHEKEREERDLARWRKHHPQLEGIDPFNPAYVINNKKNKSGINERGEREFYDFMINTGYLSVKETVKQINEILISRGLVGVRTEDKSLPKSGVIFQG